MLLMLALQTGLRVSELISPNCGYVALGTVKCAATISRDAVEGIVRKHVALAA
jgi:hypothetical protein